MTASVNFDHCINSHQPGPTSAQQKRNQHSTHRCSLCSQSLQKSVQVPWRNLTLSCKYSPRRLCERPVVSRADVWDIGFASDQMLGATKIAQLEDSRLGIKQKILEEKSCSWVSALNNRLPGAWCPCGRCRLSGCTQETWGLISFTLARTKILEELSTQSTWKAGTCRAWWRWPELFASACCTASPPNRQYWWEGSRKYSWGCNRL